LTHTCTTADATVTTPSGLIVGLGVSAASVNLAQYQGILLFADGTNYRIIAGEIKRERQYSPQEEVAHAASSYEHEYSASRESKVIVRVEIEGTELRSFYVRVGAQLVAQGQLKEENKFAYYFLDIPAAQSLKIERSAGASGLNVWTSVLVK
jgi:hypothetical protein